MADVNFYRTIFTRHLTRSPYTMIESHKLVWNIFLNTTRHILESSLPEKHPPTHFTALFWDTSNHKYNNYLIQEETVLEKQNLWSNSIIMKLDKTLKKKKSTLWNRKPLQRKHTNQFCWYKTEILGKVSIRKKFKCLALLTYQFWMCAWSKYPLASFRQKRIFRWAVINNIPCIKANLNFLSEVIAEESTSVYM